MEVLNFMKNIKKDLIKVKQVIFNITEVEKQKNLILSILQILYFNMEYKYDLNHMTIC